MNTKSICIFLSDPLDVYFRKGELKKNYYNPCSLFQEVHFIDFSKIKISNDELALISGGINPKIHLVGGLNLFNLFFAFFKILKEIKSISPSLIRCFDSSLNGALGVFCEKVLKVPVVLLLHADFDEQRKFDKRISLRIRKIFENYTVQNADIVMCVSEHVKNYAYRHRAKKIEVIYNGVDLEQFHFTQYRDSKSILNVSRFEKQKFQECIIKAMAYINASLTFIGNGKKRESAIKLAQKLKLTDKIKFITSAAHQEIHKYYNLASIFALASHYEGFCIPLIEAMASGLPVVASDIPAIKEIVADAGILVQNSPSKFAESINLLLNDHNLYAQYVEKGVNRAKLFNMQINQEKQANLYRTLLGL